MLILLILNVGNSSVWSLFVYNVTLGRTETNNKTCVKFDLFCELLFMGCIDCQFWLTINCVRHDSRLLVYCIVGLLQAGNKISDLHMCVLWTSGNSFSIRDGWVCVVCMHVRVTDTGKTQILNMFLYTVIAVVGIFGTKASFTLAEKWHCSWHVQMMLGHFGFLQFVWPDWNKSSLKDLKPTVPCF